MPPDLQRRIAASGGRAAHQLGLAHEWTPEEAIAAGRKGGQARAAQVRARRASEAPVVFRWASDAPVVFHFTRTFALPSDANLSNPPWSLLGSLNLRDGWEGEGGA